MKLEAGKINLRRKLLIGTGKVKDHAKDITEETMKKAGLDKQTGLVRSGQDDDILLRDLEGPINEAYASVADFYDIAHDPLLLAFLHDECNMVLEHKDGSFMDHLQFGYEYVAAHMPGHSGRVLLLHSIMGLGTNHFPLQKEKIPKLFSMLTDTEARHIQAFPSIVRLWSAGSLPRELLGYSEQQLFALRSLTLHRVMDNKQISLSADDFWSHLNYQLIHYADFFPAAGWSSTNASDPGLLIFRIYCDEILTLLRRAGKLIAKIEFEPALHVADIPESCQLHKRMSRWQKISSKISHSLDYWIQWQDGVPRSRL